MAAALPFVPAVAGAGVRGAQAADEADISVDGPRTDLTDATSYRVDRYGQPEHIEDALGGETSIAYDAQYPGDADAPDQPSLVTLPRDGTARDSVRWFYRAGSLPDSVVDAQEVELRSS